VSHWFDRIAVKAAAAEDERLLTRRDTLKGAAAGAGAVAVGALGSPFITRALGEPAGCKCMRDALDRNDRVTGELLDKLVLTPSAALTPLNVAIFTVAWAGLNLGTAARGAACGFPDCPGKVPSGKPPPPQFQPCTQRGGLALHDQCGGGGGGGAQQCPSGTHLCTDGLCCFGTDLCCANCGTGQCCIAEVGCACCG
jgi:hypothetical protein